MEWNSSGTSRRPRPKDEFTDLLFSWSLKEIFDENLYKHKVKKIPESFESVKHYLASYDFPLLDETRAELTSALEIAYKAPFAEVTSFKESKHDGLVYDVKVDHWRNRISDRGKEPYRTLPGDYVLLSDSKPESASDIERADWTYTFASVINISEDESGDNCTSSDFKLRTAGTIEVGDRLNKSLYVVYLMNLTTQKRIWNALRMRRNLKIIKKVLTKNDLGEENCEFCPPKGNNEVAKKLGSTLLSKLNGSQLEAILASTSKIGCSHRSSVELIWGPPGTGKTTTISTLLYILLKMKVRTLVCAPTNIAITELASRVTALVRNSVKTEGETSFFSCPLGDMLIFGNKDHLKVGSDIQEIFLDYRVERLLHCLVPLTGWKHCVASMLDFLEHCVSQHQIFVENELIKSKDHPHDEVQPSGSKSFLEFARDRFTHVASPLRRCMLTLFTHLPRSFIHEQNYQSILQLISLLDSMEMMLFEDNSMTSDKLETVFQEQVMTGSESCVDTSSLKYIRSRCLSILRSLQASLDKLGLPIVTDKTSTTEFCFQKASLIFSTISSSYKLHSLRTEPFHLLVIDEAAQVKECETTIALQISDISHAILVGDECQLPATVSSKLSEVAGFGRSLFERLSSMGHYKYLLDVQYRMHPSISRFPNSNFYLNQILDASSVQSKSYERCYLQGRMFGPYSFINIRGGIEELDEVGHSRRNMVEVAVVVKLVQKLFKAWNGSKEKVSIGLISPYAAQVAAIRDKLLPKYDNVEKFKVKVRSIDGFQGGEEDIIIISTVRSNKGGSIGFLCSPQRTNVALTRARHCLWILGNETTLSRSDSVWEALVSDAKDRQCFFNADEDSDFEKTIINVKKELEQLDDLLSGESVLFKNSRWQVLFSDDFRKSFQKLKFSSIKELVLNLLLKLASGWRPKKINVDWKCENSSYIVKQFKVDIYYVVCSIDITKDSIYKQVLKVWDILPMMETAKLFERLDSISSLYTVDFINRCNDKLFERNLEVPKSWSLSSDIICLKNPNSTRLSTNASARSVECRSYVENSKVRESLLLMKFHSLSPGAVNHLLSDLEGREVDIPFEFTDEEREIKQSSCNSVIMELDKIEQEFLENCALESYKAKDNASLMKYVQAFHSLESKRHFLKALDCLDELLVLEEEFGNFNEAADIAKSLGNVLREVDLLEKAGQFKNACLLLLSYVLSNSLWVSGNEGWPLKSFPQKMELLDRAMSVAEKVSGTFHASICAEAKVFSCEPGSLSELIHCHSASKQYKTPIGEILSIRKLLDAHFQVNPLKYEWDHELHPEPRSLDERISMNQVSCGTLFYLWDLWKVHILNMLKCLDGLEKPDFIKYEGTVRFCFEYFGVRLPDNFSVIFHLLNPDAAWVRNVDKGLVRQNRKVATLEARHFASAARLHWHEEFVSVGFRVLETLQELYESSVVKRLPKYCQDVCLLYIFDIAKFFLVSESIYEESYEGRKLQDFLQLSTMNFEFVFSLDSRESVSEHMISLRETELFKNLLEEISKKGKGDQRM